MLNSGFSKLHSDAACCSWTPRLHGLAFTGYGRQLNDTLKKLSLRSCEKACSRNRACAFFSHSGTFVEHRRSGANVTHSSLCRLCAACDLQAGVGAIGSSRGSRGKYRQPFISFARYSKKPTTADIKMVGPLEPYSGVSILARLDVYLQHSNYSGQLYSSPHATAQMRSLRIIWLSLLPPPARALITSIGVCKLSAQPPLQPLFAPIGIGAQISPSDSVWIAHRGRAESIPSDGWAEVTHCPGWADHAATERNGSANSMHWHAPWLAAPMWLYVASGSGVSINVGKTLALDSYEALADLLSRCHFWSIPPSPPPPKGDVVDVAAATGSTSSCGVQRELRRRDELTCPSELAGLDSVQVLRHYEFFSSEPRHELVMLRYDNCKALGPSTPGVMCGRAPDALHRCGASAAGKAALRRLSTCTKCQLCGRGNAHDVQLLTTKHGRCASSACWRDTDGNFRCPPEAVSARV